MGRKSDMKDEKDLNSKKKMDQRGKTPDRQKKNHTGGMDVCVL
jgi:hypothetical protein